MTRVYIASRYSRREEMTEHALHLESYGVSVVSRWLDGDHQIDNAGQPIGEDGAALVEADPTDPFSSDVRAARLRAKFAHDDLYDVAACDIFLAFTEQPRSTTSRGGRHVELGMAIAWRKEIVVVGPRENLFCWLPDITVFDHGVDAVEHIITRHRRLQPRYERQEQS